MSSSKRYQVKSNQVHNIGPRNKTHDIVQNKPRPKQLAMYPVGELVKSYDITVLIFKFNGVPIIFFPRGLKSNGGMLWPQQEARGFNLEGVFMAHLNSIGYLNLMIIFTPQEIQDNLASPDIVISTNAQSKMLKPRKPKTRQKLKGESPSQASSQSNCLVRSSSSNKRVSQRKFAATGESNEGCFGGNNGEYPPWDKIEKPHMIDPTQKRRKCKKSC